MFGRKDKSIQESMKKSMKQTNKEYQEYKAQMRYFFEEIDSWFLM